MFSQKSAVFLGLAAIPVAMLWAVPPGEFWNDKAPTEWSEKDTHRLLTKSPWARQATTQMDFSGLRQPGGGGGPENGPAGGRGGRGGGGGMGGPGGGMGGPGGEGGGGMGGRGGPGGGMGGPGGEGGGPPEITAIVRWESAAPVRDAVQKPLAADAGDFYVLSVSGLPQFGNRRPRQGQGQDGQPAPDPEAMAARRKQMLDRTRQASSLQRKGQPPVAPARIEDGEGGTLIFYFPKGTDPISLDDKEVSFTTRMGPLEVKAKFVLKEMTYKGKLAI